MFKTLFFIFLITLSFNTRAYDRLQAWIVPKDNNKIQVGVGDVLRVYFILTPASLFKNLVSKDIKDKTFSNIFYVSKVWNIEVSSNNQDALKIEMSVSIRAPFDHKSFQFVKINGKSFSLNVKKIRYSELNAVGDVEEFISLPMKYSLKAESSKFVYFIIFGFCISMLGIAYILIFRKKTRKLCKDNDKNNTIDLNEKWNNYFAVVMSRKDYERIYREQDEWIGLVGGQTPPIQDFISIIDRHQYKKNWDNQIKNEISTYFDEIKDIFSREAE